MALIQASEVVQGGLARPTPADIRLDQALIAPHTDTAEYRWVIPTLTQDFYDVLTAEKGTSTAFTTTAYQSLWTTHLKSLCANASLYEAAPFMVIQAGCNAGIEGLKFYQDTLKTRLEVGAKRMKDWLCTCAASLTGFSSSAAGCPDGDCPEETTDFYNTFGVVL
jgi:hypothetical protein